MTIVLDPFEIHDRGCRDLSSLQGAERMVFMLQEFDILMDMEGWDHCFLYEHHFRWYREMKAGLRAIGDTESVAVLDEYESSVNATEHTLSPKLVESFLNSHEDSIRNAPDWRDRYSKLRESRWDKFFARLKAEGIELRHA